MKKNIIILSVVLLSSCSAKILMPSDKDAARGASTFPGLTKEELVQGHDLYMQKCTVCHEAKKTHVEDRRAMEKDSAGNG